MEPRAIALHAFCSAKGGVGKSTLAVACAKLLAKAGRTCVLIDADLTGTSLADGLRLCAPDVARGPDGRPDLDAPPTGRHLTHRETVALRNARKQETWEESPPAPPYLNDILIHDRSASSEGDALPECRVDALFWKHEDEDGILYLPSSPLPEDVSIAVGWLHRNAPFTWLRRMVWLLDGMSERVPHLRDVVIDLPPGLVGFAYEMLSLLANLDRGIDLPAGFPPWNTGGVTWSVNPFLVTSKDHNDLLVALEYLAAYRDKLPHLASLVNRCTDSREEEVRAAIVEHFGAAIGEPLATEVWARRIDEMDRLNELFTRGDVRINDDNAGLRATLRLEGRP